MFFKKKKEHRCVYTLKKKYVEETRKESVDHVLNKLKNNKYKKISFLIGAGISTSCGIPDFRSQQGRYSQIANRYNLEDPKLLFEIKYFRKNPLVFYDYSKDISQYSNHKPSKAHYFMKLIEQKNLLNIIYTQNIDSLELKTGINSEKIVFAHGNINEGKCSACHEKYSGEIVKKAVMNNKVLLCKVCNYPVKFSVVFFGEALPDKFYTHKETLRNSDLVFIIGTTMKVKPFANLIYQIDPNTPIIIINKEDILGNLKSPLIRTRNKIFSIDGNIDEIISQIVFYCKWQSHFKMFLNA